MAREDRLIEGEVLLDANPELDRLRTKVRTLERDLDDARLEARRAREDADRALSMLRKQLSPLYRALQAVFGELDAAGVTDSTVPDPQSAGPGATHGIEPRVAALWASWKQKLGGADSAPSRVIDALLTHGEMNVAQLRVAGKMAQQTVYDSVSKLHKLGLLNKNGGRYSLKQL